MATDDRVAGQSVVRSAAYRKRRQAAGAKAVLVNLTAADFARLSEAAQAEGLTPTEAAREAIAAWAAFRVNPGRAKPPS